MELWQIVVSILALDFIAGVFVGKFVRGRTQAAFWLRILEYIATFVGTVIALYIIFWFPLELSIFTSIPEVIGGVVGTAFATAIIILGIIFIFGMIVGDLLERR